MFVKSINYWSFPGGMDGSLSQADFFAQAKKAGFEAVEVCMGLTGEISLETTKKNAEAFARLAADHGLRIASVATGLFWDTSMTASSAKVRSEALKIAKKEIDIAAWMNAGAVLVVPGAVKVPWVPSSELRPYAEVYDLATEAIGKLEEYARARKIAIGIENVWNMFLLSPIEMRDFIDQFQSEWVGSYFDTGNCILWSYPEHWIRALGKRIKRVHLKDYKREVGTAAGVANLLEGDADWPEITKALKEVGYSGPLTAEMIPGYQHYPMVLIDNTSRAMDAIIAGHA